MNFSDDSQDLDDFIALEQYIRAEPKERLEQFAAMFKSQVKSPARLEIDKEDAFGDLQMEFDEHPFRKQAEQKSSEFQSVARPEPVQPVRLNKTSQEVLKKRLEQAPSKIYEVERAEQAVEEHNFDQQLRYLEIEINKYKRMQAETDEARRNLALDFDEKSRQLEYERQAFYKFRKEKESEFKRQKQIIDEARASRQQKDKQQSVIEQQNQELLDQCNQLRQDLKRYAQASKTQLEGVKLANEKLVAEHGEMLAKITAQDKQILALRQVEGTAKKQLAYKDQQLEELNYQIRELGMNLKELQIRLEEKDKMLDLQNRQQPQAVVVYQYDYLLGTQEQERTEVQPAKKVGNGEVLAKKSIKELRQQESKQQSVPKTQDKPKKSGTQIDRKQFYNVPFFEYKELFDQFNRDVDDYIDKSEIQYSKKLADREEFVYASGARRFIFKNGTEKIVLPNGVTDIQFDNGDIKRVDTATQTSVYFYADVGTLFTQIQSYSGAVKIYRFSNDQMEKHYDDGRKVVYYPDGTMKYVYADGTEKAVFPDGEVVYN